MIPRTYPQNSDGDMVVFEVSPSGRKKWVDYIPIFDVSSGSENKYDQDGFIPVDTLTSVSGLTEWVDYIPVDFVTESVADQWTTNENGYIPVVDQTP